MAKYKGTLTLPNGRTIDNITADDINNLGLVSDDGEPIGVYGEYLPPNWPEIYDQGYWFGGYFTYIISINNNTYISISMGDFHDQFDENVQTAWEIVCSPENWGDEVIFQNPSEHFNPSTLNFLTNI